MDSRERFRVKAHFVTEWIMACQFSTPKVLCRALGLKRSSQTNFFSSLQKLGFFTIVQSGLVRENVWILSKDGLRYADIHFCKPDNAYISPSRVVNSTTIHSLSIQVALIQRVSMEQPFSFTFDKFITHLPRGKHPDALYQKNGKTVALEIELIQKSSNRIYLAYLEHIENMKAGHYSSVEYVFPTEALMRIYQRRFNALLWPDCYREKHGSVKHKMNNGKPVMIDMENSRILSLFTFTFEELY